MEMEGMLDRCETNLCFDSHLQELTVTTSTTVPKLRMRALLNWLGNAAEAVRHRCPDEPDKSQNRKPGLSFPCTESIRENIQMK